MKKSDAIAAVCRALSDDATAAAVAILKEHYPLVPEEITKRQYGPVEATQVFIRDGFIDRYSGERLVFPLVFRVLSVTLPSEFPYHPNWKADVTHPAYWEVGATVDHLVPVTHGGANDETNWITTSMARNYAKMNWTLEELGWKLYPPGNLDEWDGLMRWFLEYIARRPEALVNASMKQWQRAAQLALARGHGLTSR